MTMSYNSEFYIGFLAVFLIVYFLMPRPRLRLFVILAGNMFFYKFAGGLNPMTVIFATAILVWFITMKMGRGYEECEKQTADLDRKAKNALINEAKKKNRKWLALGLVLILGFLIYIKVGRVLHFDEVGHIRDIRFTAMLVPVGLSYYTFSAVGYLADVYWRKTKAEKDPVKVLTALTFFPIIIEGPILHYDDLMKQFDELPGFSYERLSFGAQRIFWGLFKKIVVSDRLAAYTTTVFGNLGEFFGIEVLLAVIANVLVIYTDFSGCMDIVIGSAECMGIELPENFRQPFFAKGAAEFWRRWHITLGAWFKDYVYMPLAMNPRFMKWTGSVRKKAGARASRIVSSAVPLMIVWILTGLWHGTGINYLLWGIYWGILIVAETAFAPELKKIPEKLGVNTESFGYQFLQMARTFIYFAVGRMFTADGYKGSIIHILRQMVGEHRLWTLFDGSLYEHGLDRKDFYVALAGICVIWIVDILSTRMKIREELAKQPLVFRWLVYYALVIAVLIFGLYGPQFVASDFAYGVF